MSLNLCESFQHIQVQFHRNDSFTLNMSLFIIMLNKSRNSVDNNISLDEASLRPNHDLLVNIKLTGGNC